MPREQQNLRGWRDSKLAGKVGRESQARRSQEVRLRLGQEPCIGIQRWEDRGCKQRDGRKEAWVLTGSESNNAVGLLKGTTESEGAGGWQ